MHLQVHLFKGLYDVFCEVWLDFLATGRAPMIAGATPLISPFRAVERTLVIVVVCNWFSGRTSTILIVLVISNTCR